jgi:hypothetical protein
LLTGAAGDAAEGVGAGCAEVEVPDAGAAAGVVVLADVVAAVFSLGFGGGGAKYAW